MTTPTYTPGQTLYYVDTIRYPKRDPVPVKILKVGMKYLELDNRRRAFKDTLIVDGGQYTSPGRCYVDLEVYQQGEKLASTWYRLRVAMRDVMSRKPPENLSIEDMEAIICKLTPPK